MYDSLKDWVNIPFYVKPFIKRSGSGAVLFAEPVEYLCYPRSKMQLIKDSNGAEVVSSHTLYVDTNVNVNVKDHIIFEGNEFPILNVNTFYREGRADCRVIYL
jgi:hypothetical protein